MCNLKRTSIHLLVLSQNVCYVTVIMGYFGSKQGALTRKGDEFSGATHLLMFITKT